MPQVMILGIGTSGANLNSQSLACSQVDFSGEDKVFKIKKFKRLANLNEVSTTFIKPASVDLYRKINIVFKSKKVAAFFKANYRQDLPANSKIFSLEANKNYIFDSVAAYAVLVESLSCQYLSLEGLSKTDKEILERSVSNQSDAITQSLMVATARPPQIYDAGLQPPDNNAHI
jgi:hypothetical protein